MSKFRATAIFATLAGTVLFAQVAAADTIRIGYSVSATGPGASMGIPERNTVSILPKEIAGQAVEYFALDDATDATRGVANMRKLVDENNIDAVIGSTATPASAAIGTVAAEKGVPQIVMAASASLILPMTPEKRWVFKSTQNDSLMADAIAAHMAAHGVKTIAFIGFNDAYGDGWLAEIERAVKPHNISIVDTERYARPDTSVTGQVLKIIAAKPDAVLVGGAGTPAALPQKTLKERGYKGLYYQTHGAANADFLRVGGKDVEGTFLPVGPIVVASQLPDSNPIKPVAQDYVARYEAVYGPGSATSFGAHAWDSMRMIAAAVPAALAKGKPGTAEFRAGLREGLEHLNALVLTHGIATTTPEDHNGFDTRARAMVVIDNGTWKLVP